MVFLLDNGHGYNTKGKRSPKVEGKKQFLEWAFTRDIVDKITNAFKDSEIQVRVLVPEMEDISLAERVNRVNKYCKKFGNENCLLISIHSNAMGDGSQWGEAKGWSVYTTKGQNNSDKYATIFYNNAEMLLKEYGCNIRKDTCDGDADYEENFYILVKTNCPAILTENMFFDNKDDYEFLMSDEGRECIANIHINAIKEINQVNNNI